MRPGCARMMCAAVGYTPKDQTPVVRVNNKREGLTIISTVTNQGKVRWKAFEGAMKADVLTDFFKRLIKDAERKVYRILDNLKASRAQGEGLAV